MGDAFRTAVRELRAEQFLAEKRAAASAPGVSAIALASVARALDATDLELYKLAMVYCPENPAGFYEHRLFGTFKTAEPGPPPGVSVKDWDKILQRGPTKTAAALPSLKDPLEKAKGLKRVGELLLGSRAKRLGTAIGGLDHDIRSAKGAMGVLQKTKGEAAADLPKRVGALSSEVGKLEGRRKQFSEALHGSRKLETSHHHGGSFDRPTFTPGERHAVSDTRTGAAVAGGGALALGAAHMKSKKQRDSA